MTFESIEAVREWLDTAFANGASLLMPRDVQYFVGTPRVTDLVDGKPSLQMPGIDAQKMFFFPDAEITDVTVQPVGQATPDENQHARVDIVSELAGTATLSADVPRQISQAAQALRKEMAFFYSPEALA